MEGRRTSAFRGVIATKTGKWGAQIHVNRKQLWLGTFRFEQDAAIAYDRVCLKLSRFGSLNFPMNISNPEMQFLSMYPLETIIFMTKIGTYKRYFMRFLVNMAFQTGQPDLINLINGRQNSMDAGFGGAPKVDEPVTLFGARIG